MRLKLIQFRCRPAMRWPADASLDRATRGTAKSGKPHRDLAEKRRDRMVPVVLHVANAATASAIRPPDGVAPGLRGDDLLLEACQQLLPFGQGQTQIGDIAEIIGPIDLHDVRALPLTFSPGFHQPHNPSHASTPGQRTDAKIPLWRSHPQSCGSPHLSDDRAARRWHRGCDSASRDGCPQRRTRYANTARSPSGDDRGTRPAGLAGLDRLRSTVLSRNDNGPLQDADRTAAASPRLCGPTDRICHRRDSAKPDVGGRTPGFCPSPAGHRITAWGRGHLALRLEVLGWTAPRHRVPELGL